MKHFSSLTATLFIGIIAQCHAMNQTAITHALTIKKPQSVVCLPNNTVAVLTKKGCELYDFSTNKEIIRLHSYTDETIFQYIRTDSKKEKLAIYRENNLEIYDLRTKNKIWGRIQEENVWQGAPVFNPKEDTIFIGNIDYGMDSFNYKNDAHKEYNPLQRKIMIPWQTQLMFHPTKQEMIFLAENIINIPILQLDKEPLIKQMVSTGCDKAGDNISACKYSPDGSLIAVINQNRGCSIVDLKTNTINFFKGGILTAAMAFHPTKCIIAILPQKGDSVSYWNAKTGELLASVELEIPYFYNDYAGPWISEPMDFSNDGTKLIIALETHDKCLILDIPHEALEQSAIWDEK
jgi:hypothetical protein